jgi:hypothetical protein
VRAHAGERGVVRGGSWKDKAELLTSDSRRVVDANLRDDAVGLRCVLASEASGRREPPGHSPLTTGRYYREAYASRSPIRREYQLSA